jgi:histidinol phosphatase-like PHP family hydrolase
VRTRAISDDGVVLTNDAISELLLQAAANETGHRELALERAAKEAWRWSEEAEAVLAAGRSLSELRSVGPWVAELVTGWIETPPEIPEPDATRRDFLTYAAARAVLDADPTWEATPHGDLQTHSTDSDGSLPLEEMAAAAMGIGRAFIACTDHSQSLKVARGMDREELAEQGRRIDALNETFAAVSTPFRALRSIEMDVFADGSSDMDADALATLDLVLGAFHSKLRDPNDATERYLAALRNPDVHVLAHPTTRMFDRRMGLVADWPKVFAEAARLGKAVELDATPRRLDLPVHLAKIAVAEGVEWFSMGSDAHNDRELLHLPMGMAVAALAGVPRERMLSYRTPDEITAWATALRDG